MDRKGFISCCALGLFESTAAAETGQKAQADREKEFVTNWLTDLFDALDAQLDQDAKVRLMAACGRGCFRRFAFKQEIARLGSGSVDKLVDAYKKNFEVWREEGTVHIRYGAIGKRCYCPAAQYHPAKSKMATLSHRWTD